MKLGFFTMPIHPLGKDWRQCLAEDREAFILADELGFVEALAGEHVTDQAENITSCITFIAWIAAATKNIRLGTGTVNTLLMQAVRMAKLARPARPVQQEQAPLLASEVLVRSAGRGPSLPLILALIGVVNRRAHLQERDLANAHAGMNEHRQARHV